MTTRIVIFVSLAALFITFIRCNTRSVAEDKIPAEPASEAIAVMQEPEALRGNCYICHNPAAPSHDAIIAPPLAAVKMRYSRRFPDKEEFVKNMTAFLVEPSKEKAIMYGAVERFGVMAKTTLDEEKLRELAGYIYSNKLEEPPWFQKEKGNPGMQ